MDDATPRLPLEQPHDKSDLEDTLKIQGILSYQRTGVLEKPAGPPLLPAIAISIAEVERELATQEAEAQEPEEITAPLFDTALATSSGIENYQFAVITTLKLPRVSSATEMAAARMARIAKTGDQGQKVSLSRWQAVLFIALLCILVLNATNLGFSQFVGAQGWAFVLNGPANTANTSVLKEIGQQLRKTPTSGTMATTTPITPQQYINLIVQKMTLDQKLGQLLIVQFVGPAYSLDLSTMISQYDVGAVLIFAANNNIQSKPQLTGLIQQMQKNSSVPMIVAIDQEGGTVDRLKNLDGPRPSATSIGATNDPNRAFAEGVQDAKDLSSYGINLNLAPVVDVTNAYNPQMYLRTFGNNAAIVTKMAGAYLKGLQQSGKVLGTLKHFPGLGDVGGDPHITVPQLTRSQSQLEAIDWAPYRTLIAQGDVHAVMVTHEIVTAVDGSKPSSLSYKLVTGILRNQLGFQSVIVTDSLTMEGITAYYTEAQAAVMAIQAGDDLLMGASTPADVAAMVEGLKQAVSSGTISQQRIDDSVRRILMLKYQMGLLPLPPN